ncbi:MAG TPA: T9SS type A sorting domain-containing protein [Cytophagaceae bacterium]
MKTTNTFLLLFSLLLYTSYVKAQIPSKKCATEILQEKYFQKDPERAKRFKEFEVKINQQASYLRIAKTHEEEKVYRIPVVVHVIYNNLAKTKISYEQVASQINALNNDFRKFNADTVNIPEQFKPYAADTKIEFCLASRDPNGDFTDGVVYVYNSRDSFDPESPSDDTYLKSLSYWPSDQYLNIWVVKLIDGYLGYAQFPSGSGLPGIYDNLDAATDGVVIDYKAFGTTGTATAPYNLGRTCTHEVGHWLGLKHIWGDETCGNDFVDDTPEDEGPNNSQNCFDYSSCTGGPAKLDMYNNYLDYSNDVCMNMFTNGQKLRMHAALTSSPRRAALALSPGCCGKGITRTIPITEGFETIAFTNDWQIINADSSHATSETWTLYNSGAFGESGHSISIKNKDLFIDNSTPYYDFLVTPFLNFRSVDNPVLDFNLAYAQNLTSDNTDSLVIAYNIACTDTWTHLQTFTAEDLITTTRKENNFIPQPDDWKQIRIHIPELSGKNAVKLRFENYSKGINNLYLDDIHIYKSTPQLSVKIYPNPSDTEINVEILFLNEKDVTIEIFNLLGEKVLSLENTNTISFTKLINTSEFSNGTYILRASNGEEVVTKRFFIDRN